MLFSADAREGIENGSITVTFRTWKRPQARVGGRQRVLGLSIAVDSVEQVPAGSISDSDARRAGEPSRDALLERLGRPSPGDLVWRIGFHCAGEDERIGLRAEVPTAAETEALIARLRRLDQAAAAPWTEATLRAIADHPEVVSTELAAQLGQERMAFKQNVRKLKDLGLTESLPVGYRISPRGRVVLEALGSDGAHGPRAHGPRVHGPRR